MKLALDVIVRDKLNRHLQEKLDNHAWVSKCQAGNVDAFPHRADPEGTGHVGQYLHFPSPQIQTVSAPCEDHNPRYVVNIPMRHLPGDSESESFRHLLSLFLLESFGMTEGESRAEVKKRVFVVIGFNQILSIDPSMNRAFKEFIGELPRVQGVVYRVFGFFWKPQWTRRGGLAKKIYSVGKDFLLLKALSNGESDVATPVRRRFEGDATGLNSAVSSQVPFQNIRSAIQLSPSTRYAVKRFEETDPESLGYFVVMDADLLGLRQQGEGLFTRIDGCIERHLSPSVVSLGYSLSADQPPLLRAGVRVDMEVREALGYLAYFPEPCSAFLVRRTGQPHHLTALTFRGRGTTLENRRLYRSGRGSGVLQGDAVFEADGGVTIETPPRMLTAKNRAVTILTPRELKKRPSLEAIRGTRQTHALALKWAENVYAGLDFTCKSAGKARGPLSHIFTVFDPIGRMFASPERYTVSVFDTVMQKYHEPLSEGALNLLNTAKGKLIALGMSPDMLGEVEATARRSGEAIYQELLKYS